MESYLSRKLTFFSFWLMLLVVLLHSLNINFNECNNLVCSLQYLLSHKLAQIAVPLFFIISGYLFFLNITIEEGQSQVVKSKIFKKFKTLFIPYILWCVIWFIFMYLFQLMPFAKNLFSTPLYKMTIGDLLLQAFYYPINYPFWFLRELMLFIIFTPIIYYILKKSKFYSLILLLIIGVFLQFYYYCRGGKTI